MNTVVRNDLVQRLREAADAVEQLQRDLKEEKRIVDRVWAALGISTFDGAKGKSVDERVAEATKDAQRYRWLRDLYTNTWLSVCSQDGPEFEAQVDAHIDQAIASTADKDAA